MKNTIKFTAFAVISSFLMSCAVTSPMMVTSNPIGDKVGTSKVTCMFGFFCNGDGGLQAAAKNGGISKIATVDITSKGGLLKSTVTTTVTGN
tara:strand:+ start:1445 stop:1720 length:276 start_codon:yes stop_codon:yes gene_type:complete